MKSSKKGLFEYRFKRVFETFDDATPFAENSEWSSAINRL
jgi:hypothetical protein